ncbi:right-handed parallel beta-helix repeat-containing protein [Actinomadura luteofluorescens]|uniref:right-handed parallel beta-helix repeat-containing protein n=1 Tax=Actinomadura luteofluorescens TaxID=46163 RepID=UPI002164BE4B|nr:right-handed parallel beta-helix repeat-containing protein [Actinomadura glauciflava]MCR3738620.1 Right handed beta helix region [Actinomadura glauciflava]
MRRTLAASLGTAVALAGLASFAPAGHAAEGGKGRRIHIVWPGHSIQKAVDRARPGDVIRLKAGAYDGGVLVRKRLTIQGDGDRTVLHPGRKDRCAKAGAAGMGICVVGRPKHLVKGVSILDLTVRGFKESGVYGMYTDRLTVERVLATRNGAYGITEFHSTRGRFVKNRAIDNSVEAGLYVGDIEDARGTVVAYNHASGNALGLLIRHARSVAVWKNHLVGNCVGAALVNDDQKGGQGEARLWMNKVWKNNRSCPQHEEVPPLGGTGILVFGGDHNGIEQNAVLGNRGTLPYSGGIVLFPSPKGQPARHNLVKRNLVKGNAPFDLVDRSGSRTNRFVDNRCRTSNPRGLC